ncbi:MAG: glycosyltransferase [Planctomycetes bacterium]|nr:glycosyltransferase [Planctomycetota bacterium]
MRVLHVVHEFGPGGGGTQGYVAALARRQGAAGDHVAVVCGRRRGGGSDGVTTIVLAAADDLRGGDLGNARVGVEFAAVLAAFGPDLVHVHHWTGLTNDLVRLGRASGAAVVITLHDLYTTCARSFRMPDHRHLCAVDTPREQCVRCLAPDLGGLPAPQIAGALARRQAAFAAELAAADAVLCVSRAQAELLAQVGMLSVPATVVPLGIDHDLQAVPAPAPVERLRIVNWGGLDPRKGIHVLLAAVAGSRHRTRMVVSLHGAEPAPGYATELQGLAAGCSVHWHGPFADDERAGFAAGNDVAVFPFLAFETHGLSVDEALHLGLPVVVSAHGAPVERIGGRGIAVPAGDVAALRLVLEDLVDRPERLQVLRLGSHHAQHLGSHARQLRDIYERTLTARRTRWTSCT